MMDPRALFASLGENPAVQAMAARPALTQGALGHAGAMAGQAFSPLSILDAPGRALRGGLMAGGGLFNAGVGQQTDHDGTMRTATFLPAAVGLVAGGLSAITPGLQGFAPWIGAGAAGLAQQLGETVAPESFASYSPGDLNTALGVPSNLVTDIGMGALTDPLSYAGGLAGLMKGRPGAAAAAPPAMTPGVMGPHLPQEILDEMVASKIAANSAPRSIPSPYASMPTRNPAAGDWVDDLVMPDDLAGLGDEAALLGRQGPAAGDWLDDLVMPDDLAGLGDVGGFAGPPQPGGGLAAALGGTWMDDANAASMAGYRPDLQAMMPSYTAPMLDKPYKLVNPAAGDALEGLGYLSDRRGRSGTLDFPMPPWAEVRGGNVMPARGQALPRLPDDPLGWLNQGDEAAQALAAGMPKSPMQRFLEMRDGVGLGQFHQ